MTGTIINVFTIIIGGLLGMFLGTRLPKHMRSTGPVPGGRFPGAS
jgi:uncharacterized membrane protein YqgA involved in biofilm formation